MTYIDVIYCADAHVEIGLRASINSIIRNTKCSISFHIITDYTATIDFDTLEDNLLNGSTHKLYRYIIDTEDFAGLKPLVGSRFPYAKLIASEIVPAARVIYLDADTIVELDLFQLWEFEIGAAPLAAVNVYSVKNSIERSFLISIGLTDDHPYFNTGVMIMNLDILRDSRTKDIAFEFANQFSEYCKTADQTVINALLSTEIANLPPHYNVQIRPNSQIQDLDRDNSIFHFVGAPKPWDLFAKKVLNGFPIFEDYMLENGNSAVNKFTFKNILRPVRIKRYYMRIIISMIRS